MTPVHQQAELRQRATAAWAKRQDAARSLHGEWPPVVVTSVAWRAFELADRQWREASRIAEVAMIVLMDAAWNKRSRVEQDRG